MVPQLPITVFKVRLHESHYKTGFLDLQSLGTFFFFLLIFTGMAKITFFSAHSCNHVRIYIQPWILMTTFDLKKLLLFLSCEPHADITESSLFCPRSLLL